MVKYSELKRNYRGDLMKKNKTFKDFLYDTNEIWLAIVILIIAGLLIVWRINVIMDYPSTLNKTAGTTTTTQEKATTSTTTANNSTTASDSSKTTASLWKDGKLTKSVKVKVKSGSETAAVNSLVDANLFSSYSEFVKVCKSAGVKASRIKASTFTFKAGSTKKSIAKQVTK